MSTAWIVGASGALIYWFIGENYGRHSSSATVSKSSTEHDRISHKAVVWSVSGLLIFVPVLLPSVTDQGYIEVDRQWLAVAAVVMNACIWWRLWAMRHLGEYFTRVLKVQSRQRIITDGPYRFCRHPGYLSNMVLHPVAVLLISRNVYFTLFATAIFFAVWVHRISDEEKMLRTDRKLGKEYRAYAERVPVLVPYCWLFG
eukprot:Clim_evm3s25 gene=Clim_evmTU3s25